MELSEAARRIFRGHWLIVLTCLALGAALGYVVQGNEARLCSREEPPFNLPVSFGIQTCTTYAATTRLQLDDESRGATDALASSDTARGIASSPSHIASALAKAGARRDPGRVARYGVKMNPLGTGGVLELSVSDTNPQVAAAVANALAEEILRTRKEISQTDLLKNLATIDASIADLNKRTADIDAQLDELARTPGVNTTRADRVSILEQRRSDLSAERLNLLNHRLDLLARDVARSKAAILEPARPPLTPVSSRRIPDIGLGLLLGVILGIGLAALLESFRPTLIGPQAVARAAGAPPLGSLPRPLARVRSSELVWPATRLRLAASAAQVSTVELVPAGSSIDVATLAARLHRQLGGRQIHDANASGLPADTDGQLLPVVRPLGAASPAVPGDAARTGLVLVAPSRVKKAHLDPITDLLSITGWPVLGVITYQPGRFWRPGALDGAGLTGSARAAVGSLMRRALRTARERAVKALRGRTDPPDSEQRPSSPGATGAGSREE